MNFDVSPNLFYIYWYVARSYTCILALSGSSIRHRPYPAIFTKDIDIDVYISYRINITATTNALSCLATNNA